MTGHLGMRVQARYEDWSRRGLFKWNQLEQLVKVPKLLFALIYDPREHFMLWELLKNHYGYDSNSGKV